MKIVKPELVKNTGDFVDRFLFSNKKYPK